MKHPTSSLPLPPVVRLLEKTALPIKRAARPRIWVPIPEMAAACLLFLAGGAQGWLTLGAWGEAHYKGVLFGLNAILSLLCALNLYRGDRLTGWLGGALVCASSALAYAASRTVGLPTEPGAWLEPAGLLSMFAEVGFLLVFMRAFVYEDEKDEL